MKELNEQDKHRIEQASLLYSGNHNLSNHLFNGFIKGAEYEHNYQREQEQFVPDFLIEAYGLKTRAWTFSKNYGYGCAECCTGDRCDEDCKAKYKGRRDECPHCKGAGWIPKSEARVIPIEETLSIIVQLEAERKELVEALKHYFFCRNDQDGSAHERQLATMKAKQKLESLLSKFEATNP